MALEADFLRKGSLRVVLSCKGVVLINLSALCPKLTRTVKAGTIDGKGQVLKPDPGTCIIIPRGSHGIMIQVLITAVAMIVLNRPR